MNHPQPNNAPQSIAEKAQFLDALTQIVTKARILGGGGNLEIKKLYNINGDMAARERGFGNDSLALAQHNGMIRPLPITTPNGKKVALNMKITSAGGMGSALYYDVNIAGFICQSPDKSKGYVVQYTHIGSVVSITNYVGGALLGTIELDGLDSDFSIAEVQEKEQDLNFSYKEDDKEMKGKAGYKRKACQLKFNFTSRAERENIRSAILEAYSNIYHTTPANGGTTEDLAKLFS